LIDDAVIVGLLLMIVEKMSVGSAGIIIEGPSAFGMAMIAALGISSSVIIIIAVVAIVVVAVIIIIRSMLSSSDDVVENTIVKKMRFSGEGGRGDLRSHDTERLV
jgi:hypothetical protein